MSGNNSAANSSFGGECLPRQVSDPCAYVRANPACAAEGLDYLRFIECPTDANDGAAKRPVGRRSATRLPRGGCLPACSPAREALCALWAAPCQAGDALKPTLLLDLPPPDPPPPPMLSG